jgi:hypothetical protein
MAERKRPPIALVLLPLFLGLMIMFSVLQRPQVASYRTVDVITLVGCGACIGAGLAGVGVWFVRGRI